MRWVCSVVSIPVPFQCIVGSGVADNGVPLIETEQEKRVPCAGVRVNKQLYILYSVRIYYPGRLNNQRALVNRYSTLLRLACHSTNSCAINTRRCSVERIPQSAYVRHSSITLTLKILSILSMVRSPRIPKFRENQFTRIIFFSVVHLMKADRPKEMVKTFPGQHIANVRPTAQGRI